MHTSEYKTISGFLQGSVAAPASKSVLQRAVAAAFLAGGKSTLDGYTHSNDVDVAIQIIRSLGADVTMSNQQLSITRSAFGRSNKIYTGESGLSTRLFTPLAALTGNEIHFSGSGSILKRSMQFMVEALAQFGVEMHTNNGFMPYTIKGKLRAAKAYIDGSQSSQLISGLLMALPLLNDDSFIEVNNLASKPYIDLTLQVMNEFGVKAENLNYQSFFIPGNQHYDSANFWVEGDWSGAAFWFVAAAISGDILISGLDNNSMQADKRILEALDLASVGYALQNKDFIVRQAEIKPFVFDATHCPDLFPPLAVLAAYANGKSSIKGVSRLFGKESNRALAIANEFLKQGIKVHIDGDEMIIWGGKVSGGQNFDAHNDHRMAMAGAILALKAENPITVVGADAVAKSYPDFFNHLKLLLH